MKPAKGGGHVDERLVENSQIYKFTFHPLVGALFVCILKWVCPFYYSV